MRTTRPGNENSWEKRCGFPKQCDMVTVAKWSGMLGWSPKTGHFIVF